MSIFTKITVGGRLRLAFGSLFAVLILVGGVGLYQAKQIFNVGQDFATNQIPSLVMVGRLMETITRLRQLEGAALLATDADQMSEVTHRTVATLADIESRWKAYVLLADEGVEKESLFPASQAAWAEYQGVHAKLTALADASDRVASSRAFITETFPVFTNLRKALLAQMDYNEGVGKMV